MWTGFVMLRIGFCLGPVDKTVVKLFSNISKAGSVGIM